MTFNFAQSIYRERAMRAGLARAEFLLAVNEQLEEQIKFNLRVGKPEEIVEKLNQSVKRKIRQNSRWIAEYETGLRTLVDTFNNVDYGGIN